MTEKALLVFARKLSDELKYINYPLEWSRPPLSELLPKFWVLLNHHSMHLGDMLKDSYALTVPKTQSGNINQLDTLHPELFGHSKNLLLMDYDVIGITKTHSEYSSDIIPTPVLQDCAISVIKTYGELTESQENEHRTLERVCYAIHPIFALNNSVRHIGWDLAEHADMWRKLKKSERRKLAQKLMNDWGIDHNSEPRA